MNVATEEEKERDLVAKVELRLALADSPQKFEQQLDTFLAPLLLKLASPYGSVRQAVFNTLKDILARLNSLKLVKTPVQKLLAQAKSPSLPPNLDDSNVRTYSLLLASKGIERLNNEEMNQLIPQTMLGISSLPRKAAARMFHILCKLLLKWVPPLKGSKEEDEAHKFLKVDDQNDMNFLLDRFTQFFLLVPAKADPNSGNIPRGYACPGLCADAVSFLTYEAGVTFTKNQMLQFKNAIFNFVTNGFVLDGPPLTKFLTVASTDPSDISDSAIQSLKRSTIPYENADFIDFIMTLYMGDTKSGTPPVKHELQEKILTMLNKSLLATSDPKKVSIICSIGMHSQYQKLKSSALVFIRHVAKHNYQNLTAQLQESESTQCTDIASLIRNNLYEEGWPKLQLGISTPNFASTLNQRRLQYETLGDILSKDSSLLTDLSYIEFLLDSLKGDLSEFRPSIQEALISLTVNLPSLPHASKERLKGMIRSFMVDDYEIDTTEEKDHKEGFMACRFVCIKFCNAAFPFDDAEARMFNIWGTSRTNKFDVIEESYKGLHPFWFRVNQASNTTVFKATADLLASEIKETALPSFENFTEQLLREIETAKHISSSSIYKTLNVAIRFSKQCMLSQAVYGKSSIIIQDEDWSVRIEKALNIDEKISKDVLLLVSKIEGQWFVKFLHLLCSEFIIKDENDRKRSLFKFNDPIFGEALLTFVRYCGDDTLTSLEGMIPALYNFLKSVAINNDKDLETAATVLGIISASVPESKNVKEIIESPRTSSEIDASFFASSYILPRLLLKNYCAPVASNRILESLLHEFECLMGTQKHRSTNINLLGQVTKFGTLLLVDEKARRQFLMKANDFLEGSLMNDTKAVETWSYLSFYSEDSFAFESQVTKIWETHVSKEIDFLFSAGEALSVMAGGWHSGFLQRQLDVCNVSLAKLQEQFGDRNLTSILNKLLEGCDSTKPSMRKASCIWLLSLVQYLNKNEKIVMKCGEIHQKFMRFLGDRNEFVQDSAARGLSIIYEMGDADLKEGMIKGLLKSFTDSAGTGNLTARSVSTETQIFDSDVMKTDEGSIRTYKDILNLASEVGDPSLVYKFMSLSKSSSLWSSRKGIAFGLGAIMSKSSLQSLLLEDKNTADKLIPKLFRYRFDPYPSVARSMSDIWNSLIIDSSAVVSENFESILCELLSSMASKEWRVREASSLALLQLVQSQPQEKFAVKILDIWTMAFRTMDDIKESVREAGTRLTTGLSKILARSTDTSKGVKTEAARKILEQILPFLLGVKGLNSDAEEVRSFAMKTLLDLVKDSGTAIKPFAVQLVYEFTLLFSSIEPQAINYLSLNASNYKIDADAIDLYRKNGVSNSPLLEVITRLINNSEDTMMDEQVNSAIKAVKRSVGLPSKVAASTVFNLLVKRYSVSLKPLSGKLLKCCTSAFGDRNQSVRIAFAVSFGHIYRVTTLEKAVKYAKQLSSAYFSSNELDSKIVVATAIESVFKYAPSEFENVASIFMPLVFIASNDVDKGASSYYERIWTEASKSGSGTVKLYLDDILRTLKQHIGSTDFSIRKTCGQSISVLCDKVDHTVNGKLIESLFDITIESMSGRSWEGKETLLEALASLCNTFSDYVLGDDQLKSRLRKAFTTEISRKNEVYVRKAIFAYCNFLHVLPEEELIEMLLPTAERLLQSVGEEPDNNEYAFNKRMKSSSDINQKSSKNNIEREEYAIKLLKSSCKICKPIEHDGGYQITLVKFVIEELVKLLNNDKILYTWRSQVAACEIGIEITDAMESKDLNLDLENLFTKFWKKVFECNGNKEAVENVKIQTIRLGVSLKRKVPSLSFQIETDLRHLGSISRCSKVERELNNVGIRF